MRKFLASVVWMLIVGLVVSVSFPSSGKAFQTNEGFQTADKPTAYVDVSVATVWLDPEDPRPIDQPSLGNPVDLWEWTRSMSVEQKRGLVGKLTAQALYGTEVLILQEKEDWVKVLVPDQPTNTREELGLPDGWIPKAQITYNKRFDHYRDDPIAMVTSPTASLYDNRKLTNHFMEISYNTSLPVVNQKNDAVLVATPSDGNKWIDASDVSVYDSFEAIPEPTGEDLVKSAKKFLGLPYLWAGMSGFGFDCSGFTHTIFHANGILIPRDAASQREGVVDRGFSENVKGQFVERDELQKGDLLFFAYNHGEGYVHHVGMYIGNGKMIHSPNSSTTVQIVDVFESPYYSDEYAGAVRYIN